MATSSNFVTNMGYLHIDNLYKNQLVLLFKECYVLEKIHGTSAHIRFAVPQIPTGRVISFSSGGEKYERFKKLFDEAALLEKLEALGFPSDKDVTVFGEAYGGSQQGMSASYGKDLKFVVFDVQVGENWLNVPDADQVTQALGLEFVWYRKVDAKVGMLDELRDMDSPQAVRNGIGPGKKMEGVVIRPLVEMKLNNGARVIAKHKRDEFKETATPRSLDPEKLQKLQEANAIAHEWVTPMRLEHVLQKIPNHGMETMRVIIDAMKEDVLRESQGEIVISDDAIKAICSRTSTLYRDKLKAALTATQDSN